MSHPGLSVCIYLVIFLARTNGNSSEIVNWIDTKEGGSWDDASKWSSGLLPCGEDVVVLGEDAEHVIYDVDVDSNSVVVREIQLGLGASIGILSDSSLFLTETPTVEDIRECNGENSSPSTTTDTTTLSSTSIKSTTMSPTTASHSSTSTSSVVVPQTTTTNFTYNVTSTSISSPDDRDKKSSGLDITTIIAVSIGAGVFLLIVICLIIFLVRRRRKHSVNEASSDKISTHGKHEQQPGSEIVEMTFPEELHLDPRPGPRLDLSGDARGNEYVPPEEVFDPGFVQEEGNVSVMIASIDVYDGQGFSETEVNQESQA